MKKFEILVFHRRPCMTCREALGTVGLNDYELFVEPDDFPVHPDESLDFLEEGQVLYAKRLSSLKSSDGNRLPGREVTKKRQRGCVDKGALLVENPTT